MSERKPTADPGLNSAPGAPLLRISACCWACGAPKDLDERKVDIVACIPAKFADMRAGTTALADAGLAGIAALIIEAATNPRFNAAAAMAAVVTELPPGPALRALNCAESSPDQPASWRAMGGGDPDKDVGAVADSCCRMLFLTAPGLGEAV
eukprot:CAMPEP_0119115532 /NCGR_PEP_ID=MMETSP1180-20130426/51260_1 /TAXON_ID=3052 ORGANISM="Chlamydomonas cf sp, Strain CCMP681" /NCGR_SAMPLE_ID=MMETSP1180 /ASSEMBLY_ACC=CAM_ASM_000741 /LENGTH=151 /DNA_ID=CAMNT_0007104549 /DNA_START=524 /DNA_END=976 /DNA_ORIENTATION=+